MQEIVIKISDERYKEIVESDKPVIVYRSNVAKVLANGTVLPKGHGRLIDADEYKEHLYACETNGRPLHITELDERLATVDEAPTIIEADKENEDADSN